MYKWYLPTISEIVALEVDQPETGAGSIAQRRVRAEREWSGAIAALNHLLHRSIDMQAQPTEPLVSPRGLILSGPAPILDQAGLIAQFSNWTLTANPLKATAWIPTRLLPATEVSRSLVGMATSTLSLLPDDPLAAEQFCLVLAADLALVLTLGEYPDGQPAFLFSFNPDVVWQCWRSLRSRLLLTSPQVVNKLDGLAKQFAPSSPDYQTITQFSRLMLSHLAEATDLAEERSQRLRPTGQVTKLISLEEPTPHWATSLELEPQLGQPPLQSSDELLESPQSQSDLELLKAIAHEVRTPLTTIRTLTRLLLKRKDLSPDVVKRLSVIDQECTEQIDRFGLIFRAVELQTMECNVPPTPPAAISLTQVFQQNLPRWQQQVSQRDLTLEVILPPTLPLVLADSAMLEQMLTGLIDRISHSLMPGSHIQVRVTLAGHQLKLQFQSHPRVNPNATDKRPTMPVLKSIGEMLTFQPETGSLSLNLAMTKNLFQALGGKLIVRKRPQHSEEMTIFLPLETRKSGE